MAHRKPKSKPVSEQESPPRPDRALRIIGGKFRRRILKYSGDPATRPMKDRVREAVFNLLGRGIQDMFAIDLFAGTGALGLEALSRGAASAAFFERSHSAARIIRENVDLLQAADHSAVTVADTFFWFRRHQLQDMPAHRQRVAETGEDPEPAVMDSAKPQPALPVRLANRPWCAFVSPPWELFTSRLDDMLWLIEEFMTHSPRGSLVVVEADETFDAAQLPRATEWDVRTYAPAVVGVWEEPRQPGA